MKEKAAHDAPVEEPGNPMSAALLAVSMNRYQRSRAALRASRLLIRLSRIGMARGRRLLERHASPDGGSVSPESTRLKHGSTCQENRSLRPAYPTARSTEKRAAPIDRSARAMNEVGRVLTENASPGPSVLATGAAMWREH